MSLNSSIIDSSAPPDTIDMHIMNSRHIWASKERCVNKQGRLQCVTCRKINSARNWTALKCVRVVNKSELWAEFRAASTRFREALNESRFPSRANCTHVRGTSLHCYTRDRHCQYDNVGIKICGASGSRGWLRLVVGEDNSMSRRATATGMRHGWLLVSPASREPQLKARAINQSGEEDEDGETDVDRKWLDV